MIILFFIFVQVGLCINYVFPFLLKLLKVKEEKIELVESVDGNEVDYGIIVTYYKQLDLLPGLLASINLLNYKNFVVYIVADNCEDLKLELLDARIVFLRPSSVLGNNIKSHLFAIQNFVRPHERITIIDGDNLVHSNYLKALNVIFDKGYLAVQGAREAKNTDTDYARLDAVGDLYYRYIDRMLLFESGSSATLSGSGMAFKTDLYLECISGYTQDGAGFDKVLQYEIVKRKLRIAFSNEVIVYDQKTTTSNQLIKQRARWINTWFKSYIIAWRLLISSIFTLDKNGILFAIALLRPPLFILLTMTFLCMLINIIFLPAFNLIWLVCLFLFFYIFRKALKLFKATNSMFSSLKRIPKFIFFQFIALLKTKRANEISVATIHSVLNNESSESNTKIRILHTIRQGEIGGGETHVLDLVSNLDVDKYKSYVLSFSNGPMVEKLKEMKIEVFVIPSKMPFDFRVWHQVSELIRKNGIHILHAHGTRAFSNTFFSAKLYSIPIIYTVHGWSFHPDQNSIKKWFRMKSEGYLIQNASLTVFVSESNYDEGKKHFGDFKYKIIKNSINDKKFNPDNAFSDIRKEIGIEKNAFVIGFIARITKQKNLAVLLDAIEKVPKAYNIKLIIVGNGDLREEMLERVNELGISRKVRFLDFREDVEHILNAIDVYCLPSLWEGLSIGLLEAMAMRKAVIVSNISGNIEIIKHMENGIIVQSSPEDIKNEIVELYNDEILRERLAQNAFLTIKNEFQVKNMIKKIEEAYLSLV